MWFKMKTWDVASGKRSKYQVNLETTLDCDAATAFNAFRGGEINQWFADITGAKWLSKETEQVNAIRQVNLKTMNVQEHMIHWEDNKQFTFYVRASTLPLLEAMIEDCIFVDNGNGTSKFIWNIYYEPSFLAKLLSPITRFIFSTMFTNATKSLEKFVRK